MYEHITNLTFLQVHHHVKSFFLYLCTLIVQSVIDFQSLIKLLYAVLVIAKYSTYRMQHFATD
jgi:hypothetical protein